MEPVARHLCSSHAAAPGAVPSRPPADVLSASPFCLAVGTLSHGARWTNTPPHHCSSRGSDFPTVVSPRDFGTGGDEMTRRWPSCARLYWGVALMVCCRRSPSSMTLFTGNGRREVGPRPRRVGRGEGIGQGSYVPSHRASRGSTPSGSDSTGFLLSVARRCWAGSQGMENKQDRPEWKSASLGCVFKTTGQP